MIDYLDWEWLVWAQTQNILASKLILLASVSIGGLVFAACCVIPSQYVNIGVSSLSRIIQWINYRLFGIWLDGQILIDF